MRGRVWPTDGCPAYVHAPWADGSIGSGARQGTDSSLLPSLSVMRLGGIRRRGMAADRVPHSVVSIHEEG